MTVEINTVHQNDITQLEALNLELKNQLNTSQSLSKIGSWKWDLTKNEITWTNGMFIVLGLEPGSKEPSYELALHHVHDNDKEHYEKELKLAMDSKSEYLIKNQIKKADNTIISVVSRGKCILNHEGELVQMIGTVQDISEIKSIKTSNKSLSELALVLAHDINAPVSKILSLIRNLDGIDTNHESLQSLYKIESLAVEIQEFVSNTLSNSLNGSTKLNVSSFSFESLIEKIRNSIFDLSHIAKVQCSGFPPIILGDRFKIKQVFQNLILNSKKYCHPDRNVNIQINYSEDRDNHIILFQDNGIGIDPINWKNIFTKNFRAHAEENIKGNGVGLYISAKTLDLLLGEISVTKSDLNGTTFKIIFKKSHA